MCCFLLFSIKDVNIDYTVYTDGNSAKVKQIDEDFEKYSGKNLLFLNLNNVKKELNDNPYYEIVSVEKDFPNVLSIKIKERRKAFYIFDDTNVYETTKDGIVLSVCKNENFSNYEDRQMIYLTLDGVSVSNASLGKKISTSADDLMLSTFNMATAVNLNDCINKIKVEKAVEKEWVFLYTYTGTIIQIIDALDDGQAKIEKAFSIYNEDIDDFEKTRKYIVVLKNNEGEIQGYWTESCY